jgi:hypothetical protein
MLTQSDSFRLQAPESMIWWENGERKIYKERKGTTWQPGACLLFSPSHAPVCVTTRRFNVNSVNSPKLGHFAQNATRFATGCPEESRSPAAELEQGAGLCLMREHGDPERGADQTRRRATRSVAISRLHGWPTDPTRKKPRHTGGRDGALKPCEQRVVM